MPVYSALISYLPFPDFFNDKSETDVEMSGQHRSCAASSRHITFYNIYKTELQVQL